MTDKPIFEVTNLAGKSFKIWEDGRIDGFDIEPCIVINRIPERIERAKLEQHRDDLCHMV